jgi:hypothetical protein
MVLPTSYGPTRVFLPAAVVGVAAGSAILRVGRGSRTGGRRGRSDEEADRQARRARRGAAARWVCVALRWLARLVRRDTGGRLLLRSARVRLYKARPRRWVTLRWWARSRSVLLRGETRGVRRTEAAGGRAWMGRAGLPARGPGAAWLGGLGWEREERARLGGLGCVVCVRAYP